MGPESTFADLGRRLKKRGQDAVESRDPTFFSAMRAVAMRISIEHGQVSSDDLRRYAEAHGIEPKHPNAWGAMFRGKEWQCVGYTRSAKVTNHSRRIAVWKWVGR